MDIRKKSTIWFTNFWFTILFYLFLIFNLINFLIVCFLSNRKLMCLLSHPNELLENLAYLVPLVERLSIIDGALTIMNNRGEDALYLAALNCPQFSFVVGYLAATMLEKGIDISQQLYHTRVWFCVLFSFFFFLFSSLSVFLFYSFL